MSMKQRFLQFFFCLFLGILCTVSVSADEPEFRFLLQADGVSKKQVSTGDIVTVVFTLERTDSTDAYTMYAMQNEIRYDSTFFEVIEESVLVNEGILTNNFAQNGYERELYMNFLSMSGGTSWQANMIVGSFQMRVIGTSGAGRISSEDFCVSAADGISRYPSIAEDVILVVSEDCTVNFESCGGTIVPSQIIRQTETVTKPSEPMREGYTFTGWYTDSECRHTWNFSEPVLSNLRLYAGWKKAEIPTVPLPFTDVSPEDWYYDSILYVCNNGLMNGVTDTAFSPNTAASRAMLVTILWRMEGSPPVNSDMQFQDVPQGQWYTEAIRWAASAGIAAGYSDTKFGVNDSVTREQTAVILYRYAAFKGYDIFAEEDILYFKDSAKINAWAYDALKWMVGNGLMQGTGENMLSPQGTATRAQTATLLMRFKGLNS